VAQHRDRDRFQHIARRAALIGAGKLGLAGLLFGRMYYLQVIEGERYRLSAEDNRISQRLIAPTRGRILDRRGVVLATNETNHVVAVTPEETPDLLMTLSRLGQIIPLSEEIQDRVLSEASRRRPFIQIEIQDNLSRDEVAQIEFNAPDLPGVNILRSEIRTYPYGLATAHTLGYVGAVNQRERDADDDPVLMLPGFRIGKTGVEVARDEDLRGRPGTRNVEVNAVGRVVRELSATPPRRGQDVQLTLDIELQQFAQARLEQEQSASAVVMDVETGAVRILASAPTFDPNLFSRRIPATVWNALRDNERAPLTNKAVTGQYPPGSTFKMITAMAGLRSGQTSGGRRVWCPGHMQLGNHRFHCWRRGGHGWMTLTEALEQSCDVYFYETALDIGIDRIAEEARRFGLGVDPGLDLPAVREGLIPNRDWHERRFDRPWTQGATVNASIGQGFVLATPLQLAVMTARLATGRAVQPYFYADRQPPQAPPLDANPAHLAMVRQGMIDVMNGRRGTARSAQIEEPEWQMAGKTGTAQVRRITAEQRAQGLRNEDLPWRFRHHALFVAYAPIEQPRYACGVVVEHGVSGGSAAAPIAHDLLREIQRRDTQA